MTMLLGPAPSASATSCAYAFSAIPDIIESPFDRDGDRENPWADIAVQVDGLRHLKDDWDDCGAKAPSPTVIDAAVCLLNRLLAKGDGPPTRIVPNVDGHVVIEWRMGYGDYLEAELTSPSRIEWMRIAPDLPTRHWVADIPR